MRDRELYSENNRLVEKVDNIQRMIKNDPSIYDKIPDLCSGSDIAEHKLSDGTLVCYDLTELSGDAAGISFNPEDPMNNDEGIQILTSDNRVDQNEGHIIYFPSLSKVLIRWNVDTEDELFEKLEKYLDELESEIKGVTNLSKRRFSCGGFNRVRFSKKNFSGEHYYFVKARLSELGNDWNENYAELVSSDINKIDGNKIIRTNYGSVPASVVSSLSDGIYIGVDTNGLVLPYIKKNGKLYSLFYEDQYSSPLNKLMLTINNSPDHEIIWALAGDKELGLDDYDWIKHEEEFEEVADYIRTNLPLLMQELKDESKKFSKLSRVTYRK